MTLLEGVDVNDVSFRFLKVTGSTGEALGERARGRVLLICPESGLG
jgi:hypothetical protein